MELDTKTKQRNGTNTTNHKEEQYPYSINLYVEPPTGKLSLDEAEDLFRQRVQMLSTFEMYKNSNDYNKVQDLTNHLEHKIKSSINKVNFLREIDSKQESRRFDHISHFLLRTHFAQNKESWDWFKTGEKNLLFHRLKKFVAAFANKVGPMLQHFGIEYKRTSLSEIHQLCESGTICWNGTLKQDKLEVVFKLKFEDALNLIQRRRVGLKDGYAYLLPEDIIGVICEEFEARMENTYGVSGMVAMQNHQSKLLYEALEFVYQQHLEVLKEKRRKEIRADGEATNPFSIQIEDIEDICNKHYPPCMRHMHEHLKKENHLRHQARVYYGAFLRSGGVDLDSALTFWRDEFTKKIPVDKFERDYKYNIRHLYGKEGHKKALSCFSCTKIITENPPGPVDNHGCPFRHSDKAHLKAMLISHGLNSADVDTVSRYSEEKNYQRACSFYFETKHGDPPVEDIKTPIQFYYESMRHMKYGPPPKPVLDVTDTADQPVDLKEQETHGKSYDEPLLGISNATHDAEHGDMEIDQSK